MYEGLYEGFLAEKTLSVVLYHVAEFTSGHLSGLDRSHT
jgi:hypothetical protein